jgi:TATA-binding protein-associated factor Taf7
MADNWELALIAVVEKELSQLLWLIKCEHNSTDGIEKQDVHSQVSRVTALTDLAYPTGLPLSETSIAKLNQLNETAMRYVREGGASQ